MIYFDFLVKITPLWMFWLQANMMLNSYSTRCISLMGHIVHKHWRLRRAKVDTKMTRNLPGRFSAVVFKCFLNFDGCSQTSLALFLPLSTTPCLKPSVARAEERNGWWKEMFNTAYLCQSSCSDMGMHPHAHRHSRKHTHILKHKHTHKAHVKGNENGKKPWRNKLLDIIGLYINYRLWVPVRVCFLKISLEWPTWWCSLHLGPSVKRLP